MKKLFKVGTVKDTVAGRFGVVDDEFVFTSYRLPCGGLGLREKKPV